MSASEQFYIELSDGVKRELRFTLSTVRRLKKTLGKSFVTGEGLQSLDEDVIPAMIAEALVDKSLNVDQVADLISLPDLPHIMAELFQAYTGSMPTPDASTKN